MENLTILICVSCFISLLIFCLWEDKVYESHKISPVSGEPTKITVCIHDPYFNCGFIVSLSSIGELREIQESLKNADKKYIIREDSSDFMIINNIHKREQFIKKCSYKLIKELMKKNKTSIVDYSDINP